MTQPPSSPGTGALPSLAEITQSLQMLQGSLGAYVQYDLRQDENGKASASAKVIGAYRKLGATYQALPPEAQADLFEPIQSLHETIVTLGISVGPFRLKAPALPLPLEEVTEGAENGFDETL